MKVINGDVLMADVNCIIHQTNCIGVMGGGVASAVRAKYPQVYEEYKALCSSSCPADLIGTCQFIEIGENKYLVNLFGQKGINPAWYLGGKATDYDAIRKAVIAIREFMEAKNLQTAAVPYKMGAVRGGGKWEIIEKILTEELGDMIVAYKL